MKWALAIVATSLATILANEKPGKKCHASSQCDKFKSCCRKEAEKEGETPQGFCIHDCEQCKSNLTAKGIKKISCEEWSLTCRESRECSSFRDAGARKNGKVVGPNCCFVETKKGYSNDFCVDDCEKDCNSLAKEPGEIIRASCNTPIETVNHCTKNKYCKKRKDSATKKHFQGCCLSFKVEQQPGESRITGDCVPDCDACQKKSEEEGGLQYRCGGLAAYQNELNPTEEALENEKNALKKQENETGKARRDASGGSFVFVVVLAAIVLSVFSVADIYI